MNEIDVVQEIVEITVDSGAAKSVWPIRQKVVTRTKATNTVKLAMVDEGSVVVFGQQESSIENSLTGHRIPMSRRSEVFNAKTTKKVRFDVPSKNVVFTRPA